MIEMDEQELHWIQTFPTRERLIKIRDFFTDNEVTDELFRSEFPLSNSDCRCFEHEINGKTWKGFIYLKRNSLMGSIFSYYDDVPFIIRGYPKIPYAEDSKVLEQEAWAEDKVDGTNLLFWTFPDGYLMAKTRLVERADRQGYQGNNWMQMASSTGLLDEIKMVCEQGYQVVGELYGEDNPGEFIRYTTPLAFAVFDICKRENFEWLGLDEKTKLLWNTNIPQVEVEWMGKLTSDAIFKLEKLAGEKIKENGIEGYVVKYYDEKDKDAHFAKVKTGIIKELAWKLADMSASVPMEFIRKAIKKAWDNQDGLKTTDDIIAFVEDELLEEFDEERVKKSKNRIKKLIGVRFTPPEESKELDIFFDELKGRKIDLNNKGKILSMTSKAFPGITPSTLFKAYQSYLVKSVIVVDEVS